MYDLNGAWKKDPIFDIDPVEISYGQYNLYALLNTRHDTNELAKAVRDVLEAVAFDFYATRHVGLREAKAALREDVSRIARVQKKEEGSVLYGVLVLYATLAAYNGQPCARTALALALNQSLSYGGDPAAVSDVRAVLLDTASRAPDPGRSTIQEARAFLKSQLG